MSEERGLLIAALLLVGVIVCNLVFGFATGEIYAFNVNASGRYGGSGERDLILVHSRDAGGRGFWSTVGLQGVVLAALLPWLIRQLRARLGGSDANSG